MGIIYTLSCSKCSYESDALHLGYDSVRSAERIVATCTSCNRLTTILEDEAFGDCDLCNAEARVVFTSYLTRPRPTNTCHENRITQYQCPSCESFTIEIPESGMGLWD